MSETELQDYIAWKVKQNQVKNKKYFQKILYIN